MSKNIREFIDEARPVAEEYYEFLDGIDSFPPDAVEKKLKKMVLKDPRFFEPYFILYEFYYDNDDDESAEVVMDRGFGEALALITDNAGNWPDRLDWGHITNRHIIRLLSHKAVILWQKEERVLALDLFRRLLRTNPSDNLGVRNYILALRMGLSFDDFADQFDSGDEEHDHDHEHEHNEHEEHEDRKLVEWFNENSKKFPEEFTEWEKLAH
jgi:hypothetical protein